MKELIPFVFALFMVAMLIMAGAAIGAGVMEASWKRDMRERGLMQFNQQTGNLEWKIGAVVTEQKDTP